MPREVVLPPSFFVLNEWLLNDLRGDNGAQKREESLLFVERFRVGGDRIAVLWGSPWMDKAYKLMSQTDVVTRECSKRLHRGILQDSNCSLRIDRVQSDILPSNMRQLIPADDQYLFETYLLSNATALVTTDGALISLAARPELTGIVIRHRDEFLNEYLALP